MIRRNLSYIVSVWEVLCMKGLQIRSRSPFLTLFLSGFAAGVLYIVLFGRAAVHETTLMSAYFFSRYQQIEFASEELFVYTLKSRLCAFTGLWLAGLTVVGAAAVYGALIWTGSALGITVTTAAMKMGASGILLCIVSALPHFVLYVPACCWLLRRICLMSSAKEWRTRSVLFQYLAVWVIGLLVFMAGAWLESYVNPAFLKTVLRRMQRIY